MNNIKILAVDDVEANRLSLKYLLEEYFENLFIILANNGEDALRYAFKEDIDLIILDVQMPGIDGFETAKYLRSNSKTKNIPIIFLTAIFKDDEFQQKGFAIGAVDYLTKPIQNNQFINKINLYIQLILKNKELEEKNLYLQDILQRERELQIQMQNQQQIILEQKKMVALGEMIGNIAHQWRQPLAVISAAAGGLKLYKEHDLLTDQLFESSLDNIFNTTQYLSKTIDDFRDFIKGDDKKVVFNLSQNIEKCLGIEKAILDKYDITVIKDIDDTITLFNFENGLLQSLINIINNAKDAMENIDEEDRFISICVKKSDNNNVKISVSDSGGGVPDEITSKIFEPYFTTKHQSQGTGLGLHMTYNIITEAMGGKISVQNSTTSFNNKTYTGAIFEITLPITSKENS